MAKTNLTNAPRWYRQTNDFIRGRIHTNADAEALGRYLNLSGDSVRKKTQGNVRWSFEEVLNALEFYGTTPTEVMR